MEELTRTKVSRFHIDNSLTLSQIQEKQNNGTLCQILIPIEEMFSEYDAVYLKEEYVSFIYNGNIFLPKHMSNHIALKDGKKVRVYDNKGHFVAIYQFVKEKYLFKIEKMFLERT